MGQAKQRGTFEQRQSAAVLKAEEERRILEQQRLARKQQHELLIAQVRDGQDGSRVRAVVSVRERESSKAKLLIAAALSMMAADQARKA